MSSPYIDHRIRKARAEQQRTLDLGWLVLELDLADLRDLPHVEELDLSGCQVALPRDWSFLPRLRRLVLRGCKLKVIPDVAELVLDWAELQRLQKKIDPARVVGIHIAGGFAAAPESLDAFPNLKRLEFSQMGGERVETAPDRGLLARTSRLLAQLTALEHLELSNCGVEVLPDLSPLASSLKTLDIIAGKMRTVPVELRELQNLRSLGLADLGFTELPAWLFEYPRLEALKLSYNEITELPNRVTASAVLQELYLDINRIMRLPDWFSGFTGLRRLSLADNSLIEGGVDTLWNLKSLNSLDLSVHPRLGIVLSGRRRVRIHHVHEGIPNLRTISARILELPNLQELDAHGQRIETPPQEVVEQGVDAIKAYWRQRRDEGTDYLCEAKLIIVGEAGAGKTTLVRKILDPDYGLDSNEPSTEGILIQRWTFPTMLHPRSQGAAPQPRSFGVSIWDFGGQEIYHATHQFFLTRRSVYVLLADSRKEDTDFHYWLGVVELLSGGSPILIVKNEKQDRRRDLDEQRLRARFGNIADVMAVNLATNRGLDEVVRRIRGLLEGLPHVGDALPASWKRVRETLEADWRDTISQDELLRICRDCGFTSAQDALHLSGYLHDLGVYLHFQHDPVLKHLAVLRPTWGTDAVYRVLDDAGVIAASGRFGSADLARIWHEGAYARLHDELLQLMQKFELCYPLQGTDIWIAPQLLSQDRPPYSLGSGPERVLRYEYAFMPKGMLTRFIVATHELVAESGTLAWRWGVVLERDGARCEVIEDYGARRMTLRARGPDSKVLMAIAHRELERIHRSFGDRLVYTTLVPCNCATCRAASEGGAFPLEDLKRAQEAGKPVQCRISFQMIDARALLSDAFPAEPTARDAPRREVFLSYAWKSDTQIVDQIAQALSARGLMVVRDKDELRYKDSIGEFMRRLGQGKAIVVVLSAAYLRSKSCMYELLQAAQHGDFRDRIFPVVLDDAGIFDALTRLDVIVYWEAQIAALDQGLKKLEASHLTSIQADLSLYREIRAFMDRIVDAIADMNTLTPQDHRASGFEALAAAVAARVAT